jgi:hypothetical protein
MCNRYFRWEPGWYGWHDIHRTYANERVKRYLCTSCCYTESSADDFFAEYQWDPRVPFRIPPAPPSGTSSETVKKVKGKKTESKDDHSSRYDIIKED